MEEFDMCIVCGRTSREANLLDAILSGEKEITKICETCAIVEHAVIIPKPTKKQLQDAEVPYTVYERLTRMAGIKPKQEKTEKEKITLGFNQVEKQKSVEKKEKEQNIKIIESDGRKEAFINFSSPDIKIGDLQKLKKEMLEQEAL